MARLFNNNAANYMSRSAVNLSLNGLTACSFGFWLNVSNTTTTEGAILRKPNTGGWGTIWANIHGASAGKVGFAVENSTITQSPMWVSPDVAPVGTWTRYVFTWQRSAGDVTDGALYVNGQVVTPTFIAGGYTASFVLEEISEVFRYGGMPEWPMTLDAALAWVCVWNRQLTAEEAAQDYIHPLAVRSGLIHAVALSPDTDQSGSGNDMSVTGTLAAAVDPVGAFILQQDGHGSILLEDGSGELLLENPPLFFPECLQLPSYMGAM